MPGGDLYGWPRSGLTLEKGWHFFPERGKIVTVPSGKDELVIHHTDLVRELTKAGIDYLFVDSTPPHTFHPGRRYVYQIGVKTRRGGACFTLSSGPPGMMLSPSAF